LDIQYRILTYNMNRSAFLRLTLIAPIAAALGTLKPKFIPDPMSDHYTYTHYGLGYRVSREMIEDDLYGFKRKLSRAVARGDIWHSQYMNNPLV